MLSEAITKSDQLSEIEVCEIAGVSATAQQKMSKVMTVLNNAGIYYWLRHDGSIGTTWHHVHCAGATLQLPKPSGSGMKMSNVK